MQHARNKKLPVQTNSMQKSNTQLCIYASERNFSAMGYVHNQRRNCLQDNNVEMLTYVKCNANLFIPQVVMDMLLPPTALNNSGTGEISNYDSDNYMNFNMDCIY